MTSKCGIIRKHDRSYPRPKPMPTDEAKVKNRIAGRALNAYLSLMDWDDGLQEYVITNEEKSITKRYDRLERRILVEMAKELCGQ